MLLSVLGISSSLAASLTVLPMPPVEADGNTPVQVQVYAPGVIPGDRIRVRPSQGVVGNAAIPAPDMVIFEYTPVTAFTAGDARVRVQIRGKVDEDVKIPVVPPAAGELSVSFEPQTWTGGTKGTVDLTVTASGPHPLPLSARSVMVSASAGSVGAVTQNDDGTWSAKWTASTALNDPQHVLFTATDTTAPSQVVGYGAIPILVERTQNVKAAAGSQNVLVIGSEQYGPTTAGPDGVAVKALFDPRVETATLQSVDEMGNRSDTRVDLELGSKPALAMAPLPAMMPTGHAFRVHVLVLEGNGQPWRGAAPKLNGKGGESLGEGWYRFEQSTEEAPGTLKLEVAVEGEEALQASHSIKTVDAVPTVSLSSDPAALKEKARDFKVTAHLKSADGSALTKRKVRFEVQGASPLGSTRDNGDGTYTQKYRLSSKADQAVVQAAPTFKATGLPARHLVLWTDKAVIPADGEATVTLTVVALDATGVPVPNATVKLSTAMGAAAMKPEVTTDKYGVAKVQVKSSPNPGIVALQADVNGVVGRTLLTTHVPGAEVPGVETGGSAADRARVARWQQTLVSLKIGRVGADVGPPAALTLSSVPSYTTPGAAVLVTVKVVDAQGKAVVDQAPAIQASIGSVGGVQNNGDGSYNVPVQLPAGTDGPLTVTATVAGATGSTELPTLAGMSLEAADDGGRDPKPGKDPKEPKEAGAFVGHARVMLGGMHTTYTSVRDNTDGNGRVPSDVSFSKRPIPGGVLQIDGHGGPKGMIGFDVGLYAGTYTLKVESLEFRDTFVPAHAALTVGTVKGPAYFFGGLGVGSVDTPVFRYNEDLTDVGIFDRRLTGVRLSAGAQIDQESFAFRINLAETFAPAPVLTELGAFFDLPVSGPVTVSGGYQLHLQHARLPVPPSGEGADFAKVRIRQGALSLGVGYSF